MHAECISPASRSSRYLGSLLSLDGACQTPFAKNNFSSSSPTPEKESQSLRPSPARAPPPIPRVNSPPLSESSMNASVVGGHSESFQDTTVLSDLTDEIQRVEARLAVIREEEDRMASLGNTSDVHERHDPSFQTNGRVNNNRHSVQGERPIYQSFKLHEENHVPSTQFPVKKFSEDRNTRRNKKETISRVKGGTTDLTKFTTPLRGTPRSHQDSSIHTCEVIEMDPVPHALGRKRADPKETTQHAEGTKAIAAHLARASPSSSSLSAEQQWTEPAQVFGGGGVKTVDADVSKNLELRKTNGKQSAVFSLAPFLKPIKTVDVEIAQGVYEKLDIFAGDTVTDIATKFIVKHALNMERALEPLCAFLKTVMVSPSSSDTPVATKFGAEKASSNSKSVTRSLNERIEKSGVSSHKRISVETGSTEGLLNHKDNSARKGVPLATNKRRASSCQSLPGSTKGIHKQSTKMSDRAYTPVMSKTLVSNAEKRKCDDVSLSAQPTKKKQAPKQREWHVSVSRSTDVLARSCSEESFGTYPHSIMSRPGKRIRKVDFLSPRAHSSTQKSTQSRRPTPLSAFNDMRAQQTAAARSTSALRRRSLPTPSVSAEKTTRGAGAAEREAPPPFVPSLAPRSIALAARDAARQDGPAYARLHARAPKLSRAAAPRRRSASASARASARAVAGEQIGKRLYKDAVEQQRRMRERRASAERVREEKERHSLRPGPQINENAQWLRASDAESRGGARMTWPRCAALPRREANVKCSEEKELEACTFAPTVNPASVRMFNMVVRSHSMPRESSKDEMTSESLVEPQTSVPLVRSRSAVSSAMDENGVRVEDRLLQLDRRRRKKLDDERHFRETIDPTTGQQLFRPFIGR